MDLKLLNRRFGLLTISSVFLLLIAGGVVRSTGSGMGCPDWPKCFDGYVPPSDIHQLPHDYKDIYLQKRLKKAEKFASMMRKFGFKKEADQLLKDPELYIPENFNTLKAWTEYVNRIVGVLSGIFAMGFFITLFKVRHVVSRVKFWCGITGFILMIFNGWLGSIVVATNLFPIIVTVHYLAAYAALAFFMISVLKADAGASSHALKKYRFFYLFLLAFSLVQIAYGTQLRQLSDTGLKSGMLYRDGTLHLEVLGDVFSIHRIFAILLVILSCLPVFGLWKNIDRKWRLVVLSIPLTLVIQYISGVLNLRYNFPVIPQVSHVFFAGIIFGLSLYICTSNFSIRKKIS